MASLFTFGKDEKCYRGEKNPSDFFFLIPPFGAEGLPTSLALGDPPRGTGWRARDLFSPKSLGLLERGMHPLLMFLSFHGL